MDCGLIQLAFPLLLGKSLSTVLRNHLGPSLAFSLGPIAITPLRQYAFYLFPVTVSEGTVIIPKCGKQKKMQAFAL